MEHAAAKASACRILVVEDEPAINDVVSTALRYQGHTVTQVEHGLSGLAEAEQNSYDLIVLDVMLPGLTGSRFAAGSAMQAVSPPFLFLTARDDPKDRINGFVTGGDDYLTKPFSVDELVLRVGAILRRTGMAAPADLLSLDDLTLDPSGHEVRRAGQLIELSATEFRLLHYLMVNVNTVVSKAQILVNVWDYDYEGSENVVELYIGYLRRKIDDAARHSFTPSEELATCFVGPTRDPSVTPLGHVVADSGHANLGALALGVYVERSVGRDLVATVEDELTRALTAGTVPGNGPTRPQPARPEPNDGPTTTDDTQPDQRRVPIQLLLSQSGEVLEESPAGSGNFLAADQLAALAGTEEVKTVDGEPRYQVRTAMTRNGETAIVALSLEEVDSSMASLRRNLIIGGLSLVIAQAAVVWLIAGAVARPVTRMSEAAHRIASGELDSDVGPAEGPRETAALANDLAQMLTRLRGTIEVQEAAAAEATRAKHDMERFIADASHELRTPLTALKGYSDLYQNGMLDDDGVKRAMGRIGSESERLTRLVIDLLKLVRTSEVEESVDLAAIVSAVCHDVRAANPDRVIDINIVDHHREPPTVTGDPHHLHQAVLNLAANACHHTPNSTPVELGLMTDEHSVFVSVIDHGPGVDPTTADQLFLPFTRGDESRSRASHDGAGLGLALVHQIVEHHRGSVVVTETPGGGATFTIRIPRTEATSVTASNL